jgi:hypothetical protein
MEEDSTLSFNDVGAAHVIAASLELLAELEDSDENYLPSLVVDEMRRFRAVLDEHLTVILPHFNGGFDGDGQYHFEGPS